MPPSCQLLDKQQRTMLQTIRNPEVLALLHLPLQEILRLLEEEMMVEDDSLSSTSKRELQSLQGVLSKMSVASVLGLANISRFRRAHVVASHRLRQLPCA